MQTETKYLGSGVFINLYINMSLKMQAEDLLAPDEAHWTDWIRPIQASM